MLVLLQVAYLATANISSAQSILKLYGQVIDEAGPVFNAAVIIDNTTFRTSTDHEGFFYFYDIPPGDYRLECVFKSIEVFTGDRIAIGAGSPSRRDIFLKNDILNIPPVQVESSRLTKPEHMGYIVKVYDVERQEHNSIDEIINKIPGLNLITSSATGEINISANGVRPEGVNVLVDGRRVNSILTGRADLSQLPLKAISRIEYYSPGVTPSVADGGLGGTVNFITSKAAGENFIEAYGANGSFSSEDYSINAAYSKPDIGKAGVLWERRFKRNDYGCSDYFGHPITRQNAFASYDKYYLSYSNTIKAYYYNISGFIYEGKNGVPGPINDQSTEAVADKKTVSTGADIARDLGRKGSIKASVFYQDRNTRYKDYGSWIPYSTKYYERQFNSILDIGYSAIEQLEFDSKLYYAHDLLNGMDYIRPDKALGRLTRKTYSIQNSLGFNQGFGYFDFTSGLSYFYSRVINENYTSGSVSSALIYRRSVSLGCRMAYADAFRLPGLAELNWKEDVFVIPNPNLKPERSRSLTSEIFCEYELLGDWRMSLEYRDVRYRDLIYWEQSMGLKYKPVNVAKSDLFSTTAAIAYNSPGNLVKIDLSRIKSVPLNREDDPLFYGKYMTHQPLYINRLDISLNYHGNYAGVEIYGSGESYFIKDNIKRLEPYTLINLKAGIDMKVKKTHLIWELKILNLSNEEYELLEYQPMLPRNYNLSLTIKI